VDVLAKEMAYVTENAPTGSTLPEAGSAPWPQPESDGPQPAEDPGNFVAEDPEDLVEEDPGYLVETGQAVGEDGSVVPIIGGLPAVEGSAWDIGAAVEDRGVGLANEQGSAGA
jgi:hypothetical protein